MNKHIHESELWLDSVTFNPEGMKSEVHAALAQAEATLALAHEARTANKIAYMRLVIEAGAVEVEQDFADMADVLHGELFEEEK